MRLFYPIGEQEHSIGEVDLLTAFIAGEMAVNDVPIATWANPEEIKAGDNSPLEVVVEVPVGRSKRGWNYQAKALESIVGEVMEQGLPGFLGHQKAENVSTEFPLPVTHWIGAKFEPDVENKDSTGKYVSKGAAYFRGIIDKSANDLKRWIKSKVIRQVSIFGYPILKKVAGEINVIDYRPLSIDWVPLGRPGMPTKVVALGELDGSYEELKQAIKEEAYKIFDLDSRDYLFLNKLFDKYVIIELQKSQQPTKLYQISYAIIDGNVQLGDKKEVVEKTTYESKGEIEGGNIVSWKENVEQLNTLLASGEITKSQVIDAINWGDIKDVIGEIDSTWLSKMETDAETLKKVKEILNVTGEMDVLEAVKSAANAVMEEKKQKQEKTIQSIVNKKVSGEMAQAIVSKMLNTRDEATEEEINGKINKILSDETVKKLLSSMHIEDPVPINIGGINTNSYTKVKRHQI